MKSKKYIPILVLLFVFLFCTISIYSKNNSFLYFSHLTVDDGLSQSTVFSITQDKFGNMWFATYDGLNCYNGYYFTVYKHNSNDSTTISDNILRVVYADSRGEIWVGTHSGLSFYDNENDNFKNYYKIVNGNKAQVNSVLSLSKDTLIIGTNMGLYFFDIKNEEFSQNNILLDNSLSVNCLMKNGNLIYIGTDNNVYIYNISKNQINKLSPHFEKIKIQSIIKNQKNNSLWIGTEGTGLFYVNLNTLATRQYTTADNLNSLYVRSLCYDLQGKLWIGTFNGLNIYEEETGIMESFTHNPVDSKSISQNSIRSIYLDAQGGMWIGTYFGGCDYYHPLKIQFKYIQNSPLENSLSDNVVSCIVEDKNGNLWIGTNDYGLNFYDIEKDHFTHFDFKRDNKEIGSNNIKAIFLDELRKNVYVGTHSGGLIVLNLQTKKTERYLPSNSNLKSENIYAIISKNDKELWIGTLNGLFKFNLQTKTFSAIVKDKYGHKLQDKQITYLYEDTKNRLWIGSDNNLSVYSVNDDLLEKIPLFSYEISESIKFVNCIMEDSRNLIWIGTREGLYVYNEKANKISHLTVKDGLPNDVIYGILEDELGRIWLSTNYGLSCFSLKNHTFRNFTVLDGLPSNQFNMYSFCKTSSGKMLFGGIKGIVEFYPEKLIDNPYAPMVELTEFYIFNKRVQPNDQTKVLKKHINLTNEIRLKPHQSSFSIEFVVPNYVSGRHNMFAYKLENYEKDWTYTTSQRIVSYSNLPAGKYIFQVKAANSAGIWNNETRNLVIVILPVWYKTWWAYTLFSLVIIMFAFAIFHIYKIRLSMENEIKIQSLERKKIEELTESKIRFFIDISHEIRTPLTLILSPLQEIMQRTNDQWLRSRLNIISKNTNRLLYLTNQLMDYRRIEVGVFKLKVIEGNAYELIKECFLFYKKLAESKKIVYSFHSELKSQIQIYDPNYLELIINNLLSNAFKFTKQGGAITISAKEENDSLIIQVSDTGVGIPLEKQQQIFKRFYCANDEINGSGIGLSLTKMLVERHHGKIELISEVGEGSNFIVYIPQDRQKYSDDEFVNQEIEADSFHYLSMRNESLLEIEEQNNNGFKSSTIDDLKGKKGSILVVANDDEILQYLKNGLSDIFIVDTAKSVEETMDIIFSGKKSDLDLVIIDIVPESAGIKLCKTIKQNITTCHISVIILSLQSDVKDQINALDTGADDYITKPFSLLILRTKIQNILRTKKSALEFYSHSLEIDPTKVAFNRMDEELLKKAKEIVEKNLDNSEFTVNQFAEALNMSRSNLHLKLKAITGESALNFIYKIRLNKACELLQDGRYSISQISTMVGFNSPSYFTTSFKKYFNCLPTEYIKKSNQQQN